jgi:alpha-tubulin suppressor-like RCC1 family protein
LGTGNTAVNMNVATPASVLTSMPTSVACGTFFTCVSVPGGIAQCWGANDAGQLGNGNTSTSPQLTPTQVTGASGVQAVAAGTQRACVRFTDGRLACWGQGPIGDGTTANALIPKMIQFNSCF